MENHYLVTTSETAFICKGKESAADIASAMLQGALENLQNKFMIVIEPRSAAEVKRFLSGEPAAPAPVAKEKKPAPAKAPVKAPAKAAAPAAPKKAAAGKSNKQIVLDFLATIDKDSAVDTHEICKRTKLPNTSVSPIMSSLRAAHNVGVVTGGKMLRFYGLAPAAAKTLKKKSELECGAKINCAARGGRAIAHIDCVPNDESGACRRCEHVVS